jgi:tetratricopeptide (TPR) repeat protein
MKKAFEYKPDSYECAIKHFYFLYEMQRQVEGINFLRRLQGAKIQGKENTQLVELLLDGFHDHGVGSKILVSSRHTADRQFLIEAYRGAAAAATAQLKLLKAAELELCLANIYYTDLNDVNKATRIWQRHLNMGGRSTKQEGLTGKIRLRSNTALSQVYFRRALASPRGSAEQEAAVKNLEQLVLTKPSSSGEKEVISVNPASRCLGHWYKLAGKVEDAHACFKVHVKRAIEILSDDDPENDIEGYKQLGYVLVATEHNTEAIGLFHMLGVLIIQMMKGIRGEKEEKKEEKAEGHAPKESDRDEEKQDETKGQPDEVSQDQRQDMEIR